MNKNSFPLRTELCSDPAMVEVWNITSAMDKDYITWIITHPDSEIFGMCQIYLS